MVLVSGLLGDEFFVIRRRRGASRLRRGLVSSSLSIQVALASELIFSGASLRSSLTSVTVPETGE